MPSATPTTTAIAEAERRSARGSARRASPNWEKSHRSWNSTRIVDSRGNFGESACTVQSCQATRIATGTAISAPIFSGRYGARAHGAARPLRRVPAQRAPLDAAEDEVDRDAEEAGGERERVELRRSGRTTAAKFTLWPRPGVPMKSSAVNARISATVDEIRRPVAMYGTALGSVIR